MGEIAHFKRDYDFKKAGYDVEVNTAKASADLAYTLQAALMTQQIKEQETQVKVIEDGKKLNYKNRKFKGKSASWTLKCVNPQRPRSTGWRPLQRLKGRRPFWRLRQRLKQLLSGVTLKPLLLKQRPRLRLNRWPKRPMHGMNTEKRL